MAGTCCELAKPVCYLSAGLCHRRTTLAHSLHTRRSVFCSNVGRAHVNVEKRPLPYVICNCSGLPCSRYTRTTNGYVQMGPTSRPAVCRFIQASKVSTRDSRPSYTLNQNPRLQVLGCQRGIHRHTRGRCTSTLVPPITLAPKSIRYCGSFARGLEIHNLQSMPAQSCSQ